MEMNAYVKKLKNIHEYLLDYLDNRINNNNEFINQISYVKRNKQELKDLLYLISRVSANHQRSPNLFPKIELIILQMKTEIINSFSNLEIFIIFEKCKNLLLFLFNEEIIVPDRSIFNIISDYKHTMNNYPTYFNNEFKNFFDKPFFHEEIEHFEEKMQIGENESYICELIRNDSIDDFIIYVNKYNISLNSCINDSIFETNPFLVGKKVSLIEYSAFFGSIQIFQYLRLNLVSLTSTLWIYAIHGRNPELFHLLEDNHVTLDFEMKTKCLKESIKCHHNEFTEYIECNFFNDVNSQDYLIDKIKHHNYLSFPDEIFKLSQFFFYFCKYDYFEIVKFQLENEEIDVNMTTKKTNNDKKDGYEKIFYQYKEIKKYYTEENTPLCVAIKKGNKDIVQLLLEQKNICVNQCFEDSYSLGCDYGDEYKTPLSIAVENENLEIVQLLLKDKNISINSTSDYSSYSEELGGLLKEEKAPLHIAVEKQNIEILKCLLKEKNIDINIQEKVNLSNMLYFEKTALHIAIEKGNEEIVQILLSENINQSIGYRNYRYVLVCDAPSYYEDIENSSSLILAYKYKNWKIISLLLANKILKINK